MTLFFGSPSVLFFAVAAAVHFIFFIGEEEYMIDLLLDGSDAARIFAVNDIDELARKRQLFLFHDDSVLNDIDGDIVIDIADDIQFEVIDWAFDLNDVLAAHLAASGIFDDRHAAVHLIEL